MTLDPNRWTLKTQEAVREAIALARDSHNAGKSPRTISCRRRCPKRRGCHSPSRQSRVSPLAVRNKICRIPGNLPKAYGSSEPSLSRDLLQAFERAEAARTEMGDEYLSVEHLLLAAGRRARGTRERTPGGLEGVRGSHRVTSQEPRSSTTPWRRYGRDLTDPPGAANSIPSSVGTTRSVA